MRVRQCNHCGYYFDTEEVPVGDPYRKKHGRRIYKKISKE